MRGAASHNIYSSSVKRGVQAPCRAHAVSLTFSRVRRASEEKSWSSDDAHPFRPFSSALPATSFDSQDRTSGSRLCEARNVASTSSRLLTMGRLFPREQARRKFPNTENTPPSKPSFSLLSASSYKLQFLISHLLRFDTN